MQDSLCQTSEFSFEHPSDWVDRTVIVRSAPPGSTAVPPNFVIAHDKMQIGENLGGYVNRQTSDLMRTAKDFQLELRRDIFLAGRDAAELLFTWGAGPGTMKQRQVYCMLDGGRVISVATTALASTFDDHEPVFDRMLNSFRWV
jgi:hypothetical protein